MHNSGGGDITGGARAYAGLFQGNGRLVGLRGENSAFIEFQPDHQTGAYHTAVVGIYNSDATGGNNGGSTGSGDSYFSIEANVDDDGNDDDLILQDRTSNGRVGIGMSSPSEKLEVSGNASKSAGGNTWVTTSDRRLKRNIRAFEDGLAVIDAIRPVRYEYNGLAETPEGHEMIGVIAQDIKEVAPYTVGTFKRKLHPEDEAPTELFSFNSHALTFALINAVQEQQDMIDSLKSQNSTLAQRNAELEQRADRAAAQRQQMQERLERLESIVRQSAQR
jgi:hypothetical protein